MRDVLICGVGLLFCIYSAQAVEITETFILDTAYSTSAVQDEFLNGLSAQAIFTLDTANPTELKIELFNTSTGVPFWFDSGQQLLTAVSFDFGHPGYNGDASITGGTVIIGPGGQSLNFDQISPQLGEYADVSGEWGYGNFDGSGMLTNFVSATNAGTTRMGTINLDSGDNLDGPQAGIAVDPQLVPLGGTGAIVDSVIIQLTLDSPLANLDFLQANGVMAEFGSDAAYLVPEPATILLFGLGMVMLRRKRA